MFDVQDDLEAIAKAFEVHILGDQCRSIAICRAAEPQGGATIAGDAGAIDPVFVGKLEDKHGVEIEVSALGDATDFVEQLRRPLLDRRLKISVLDELLDEVVSR